MEVCFRETSSCLDCWDMRLVGWFPQNCSTIRVRLCSGLFQCFRKELSYGMLFSFTSHVKAGRFDEAGKLVKGLSII